MSSAIKALTRVQVGKETTRGTAVAATRRLVLTEATYRRIEEQEQFEGEMNGLLVRTTRPPLAVRNGTELEIAFPLDFEQILFPLLAGVKGGVTPTQPGTGDAELWTFTPGVSADPAPDAYTLEFDERSGADAAGMEAPYGIVSEIVIAASFEGVPTVNVSLFAQKTTDGSSTGSIALPTLNKAAGPLWAAYFDDAWADLGDTQVTGQIYGFSATIRTGLSAGFYMDGRSTLDFTRYEVGPRMVDLTLDVTHDPASAALIQSEEAHKSAGTTRFVRLQVDGPAFDSPDNALAHFVRLDGAYSHAPDSMQDRGGERDGNLTTQIHLQSVHDATQGQDFEIAVQNALAAFP